MLKIILIWDDVDVDEDIEMNWIDVNNDIEIKWCWC